MGANSKSLMKLFSIKESAIPQISSIDFQHIKRVWLRKLWNDLAGHYWWSLPLAGLIIIFLETKEHFTPQQFGIWFYLSEVGGVISVLLVAVGLTRILLGALADRGQAINVLRLKHDIAMELTSCQDVGDIAPRLVDLIVEIIPSAETDLAIYNKSQESLLPALKTAGSDFFLAHGCAACLAQRGILTRPHLHLCERGQNDSNGRERAIYCLPLLHGSRLTGLARFSAPQSSSPTVFKTELLEDASHTMGNVIGLIEEKKAREAEAIARKMKAFQEDMARDLHDTVAQNVSYLRLKLNQFAEAGGEDHGAAADLEQMCSVAGETYDLVRGTLALLQSGVTTDLHELFSQYARQVADRSGLDIRFQTTGEATGLSFNATRQLFFIYREALSNIEKHARASQVQINLSWSADRTLTLRIADNGRGFNPFASSMDGHYGVRFMRERCEQLHGNFAILSGRHTGTQITVRTPVGNGNSAESIKHNVMEEVVI